MVAQVFVKTFFVYKYISIKYKMIILILIYFLAFYGRQAAAYSHQSCNEEGHEKWICDYMEHHNKQYSSAAEMKLRRSKLLSIKLQSSLTKSTVQFGLTSRSDRFIHELKRNVALKMSHHRQIAREHRHVHYLKRSSKLPPIDWRDHRGTSYVSPVLDQGECGCCFAFAAATVLEYWSKKHGHPKPLSVQNIMDCTSGPFRPDVGCDGGLMEYVFEYAKEHPMVLFNDYPYKEEQHECPRGRLLSHVQVKNYEVVMHDENPNVEQDFEHILHNYGPISVGIDSTPMENYSDGIFPADLCTTEIDHAVAIVGYTKDAWIIKNSWGPTWGRNGYLYLERGKNACGIAEYGVYVTSASPIHKQLPTNWQMSEF